MPKEIPFEKMQELGHDLGRRLGEGASEDLFTGWISDDPERKRYLSSIVFGTIRWEKLHGRPKDAPLASGFLLKHQACWFSTVGVARREWQDVDDVGVYDVVDKGDDYYRVGFVCIAVPHSLAQGFIGKNQVIVSAKSGQEWVSIGIAGSVGVTGQYVAEFWATDGFIILDDFVFA